MKRYTSPSLEKLDTTANRIIQLRHKEFALARMVKLNPADMSAKTELLLVQLELQKLNQSKG